MKCNTGGKRLRKARRDVKLTFSDKTKNENAIQTHPKEERRRIEELTQAGSSNKKIAEELGRNRSTIGRELKRNYGYGARHYEHERAQKLANKRRKGSKGPRIREKVWQKVFELFKMDFSPEQIANVVKINHESIYRRIYAEIKALS